MTACPIFAARTIPSTQAIARRWLDSAGRTARQLTASQAGCGASTRYKTSSALCGIDSSNMSAKTSIKDCFFSLVVDAAAKTGLLAMKRRSSWLDNGGADRSTGWYSALTSMTYL